jgi:hypothetical protein
MAEEGHSVRSTAAVLRVSESGYYAWRRRLPSSRLLRHAWLTELILSIHHSSKATYGSRRIHHELQQGYGVNVSRGTVELLMRQAGIQGQAGRIQWAASRVPDSRTTRRLWVTDARAHHTSTGTLYCAVVLDMGRRRLMGWSTDRAATREMVHGALNDALTRDVARPLHIQPHYTQWTAYAFTERMRALVPAPASAQVSDQYVQASVDRFWGKVDRHLPPQQCWNTPEDLRKQLKGLLEEVASRECQFDEWCACGVGPAEGITIYARSRPASASPEASQFVQS